MTSHGSHGMGDVRNGMKSPLYGARAREGKREPCEGGGGDRGGAGLSLRLPAPAASPPPPPSPPFPDPSPPYVLPGTSAARPIREHGGGRAAPKHHSACIPSYWELTGCFANKLRAARRGGDARKTDRERERGEREKRNPSVCVSVFLCQPVWVCLCVSVCPVCV